MTVLAPERHIKLNSLKDSTAKYLSECERLWAKSSADIPSDLIVYSRLKQARNDRKSKRLLRKTEDFSKLSQEGNMSAIKQSLHRKRYQSMMQSVLGFTEKEVNLVMQPECGQATKSFIKQAKAYDSTFCAKDIYQACRNVWMLNALQLMLGRKVETTPSVFAYSLLYPYTDNYLDNPSISNKEKHAYFKTFKKRLEGVDVDAKGHYEKQLFALITLIESQYNRRDYPEVYEAMIEIHRAQQASIELLLDTDSLSDEKIRRIVFQKGGTSVLADGYLVSGKLSDKQAEACYFFGVILQLLDDLQDIAEDRQAGLKTIYSSQNLPSEMDHLLNQTLHFVQHLKSYKPYFKNENSSYVIDLIVKSCHIYMGNNVCRYPELYTKAYVHDMNKRLPVKMTSTNLKRKELIYSYIDNL